MRKQSSKSQERPILFTDLDGPILDVKQRYYKIYRKLAHEIDIQARTLDEYWDLKRKRTPEYQILRIRKESETYEHYLAKRSQLIESETYLAHDCLQDKVEQWLKTASTEAQIVVITMRRNRDLLRTQLRSLKVLSYFESYLNVGTFPGVSGAHKKAEAMDSYQNRYLGVETLGVVGDSEIDIVAAKSLGLKSIAVRNGIREDSELITLKPTLLINSITDLTIQNESLTTL